MLSYHKGIRMNITNHITTKTMALGVTKTIIL